MAVWTTRSSGYKLGVIVFFLAAAFYLLGFATPFWMDIKDGDDHLYSGLWMDCFEIAGYKTCKGITGDEVGWFKAVEALQCLGMFTIVVAAIYAVAANARTTTLPHSRLLEFLAAFSGVSGLTGCVVYFGKLQDITHGDISVAKYYGWSFGLSVTGCLLSIISSVVIAVGNRANQTLLAAPVVLSQAGAPVAVNVTQGGAYPPVYGYDQGYPGGYAPAAVPQPAGFAPQAGYAPPAPKAGYAPAVPQASRA